MEIYEKLQLARKKAGLSQEEAAMKIGTKQKMISRYETGEVEPTIGRFRELCVLYKASADEILGLVPKKSEDFLNETEQDVSDRLTQLEKVVAELAAQQNKA